MTLPPGTVVGGRYVVKTEIASGGMGTVYAVENRETGRPHALKVINSVGVSPERALERFRREAQLLDSLDHPGVVKMTDAGMTGDGSAFLVMELLEGETVLDYLRREAPVSPAALVPIVEGMAVALDAIHAEGVIHRDLKPSNVFVTPFGVKLVDFGVAHGLDLVRLTITGQVVGTMRYMSPEQLDGKVGLDRRTDVYSMGIIVWAALAGGPPHGGTIALAMMSILSGTPRLDEVVPGIATEIADVVQHAVTFDRGERFTSAGAFAAAFARVAVGDQGRRRWSTPTGFAPLPATRAALPHQTGPLTRDSFEAATTLVDPPKAPAPSGLRALSFVLFMILLGGLVGAALFLATSR